VQVVGPITSHYRWGGQPTTTQEWLLLCKTTAALAGEVTGAIAGLHPYDVPEVLVTPVVGGNPAYLTWLAGEVREVRDGSDVSEARSAT
jgi:periplasmic divalent cation tolerance protein